MEEEVRICDYCGRVLAEEEGTPVSLLEAVADKRKCLIRGQEIDYAKAAGIVMEEFRNGKIGRF